MWGRVRNVASGEPVLGSARRCVSFFCRLRGLTFRRALGADEGLWLVGSNESRLETAIHMLFVFFPIAAVWLDARGRVVDKALARPFQLMILPQAPARDVLEGPPALLEEIAVGDRLVFESEDSSDA